MKDKLIHLFLAFVLVVCLIPTTAFAEPIDGGSEIPPTRSPGLYATDIIVTDFDPVTFMPILDVQPEEEREYYDIAEMTLSSGSLLAFYYYDGQSYLPVSQVEAGTDNLTISHLPQGDNFYQLSATSLGQGYVFATIDDVSVSPTFNVIVALPDRCFSSKKEISESSLLTNPASYTDSAGRTFYFLMHSDWSYISENASVYLSNGGELADVELVPDGTASCDTPEGTITVNRCAVKITLKDNAKDDFYLDLNFDTTEISSGNSWEESTSLDMHYTAVGLVWCYLNQDDNGNIDEPSEPFYENQFSMTPNTSSVIALYYFDGESYLPVTDAQADGCITITPIGDGDHENYYELSCHQFGDGTLTATANNIVYTKVVTSSLPEIGFYDRDEMSAEAYIPNTTEAARGERKDVWLEWHNDSFDISEIFLKSALYDQDKGYAALSDLLDGSASLPGVEILRDTNGIKLTLDTADVNSLTVIRSLENDDSEEWLTSIMIFEAEVQLPVISYNGKDYTIGIGNALDGHWLLFDAGSRFGSGDPENEEQAYDNEPIYLAALENRGQWNEKPAPNNLYQYISDVEFTLSRWQNLDDNAQQTTPNFRLNPIEKKTVLGVDTWMTSVHADAGKYCVGDVTMTFTVTLPTEDPQTFTVTNEAFYVPSVFYNLNPETDLEDQDLIPNTAEKLNKILSSNQSFLDWFEAAYPAKFNDFNTKIANPVFLEYNTPMMTLTLPGVDYEDIIHANLFPEDSYFQLNLNGNSPDSEDGAYTVLPGLSLEGHLDSITNIHFTANGNTMSDGQNTFTCGILGNGSHNNNRYGAGDSMASNCTFSGFDYGIHSSVNGYIFCGSQNTFINCGVGIYMACGDEPHYIGNSFTDYNRFIDCGTAFKVVSLPSEQVTPYSLRVYDSDFINSNPLDFDVDCKGNYYFYRNFYGAYEDGKDDAVSHPSNVREGTDGTHIITNPRRVSAVFAKNENFPSEADPTLVFDKGPHAAPVVILNEISQDLVISTVAFDDLSEKLTIQVVDNDGNLEGFWTFAP